MDAQTEIVSQGAMSFKKVDTFIVLTYFKLESFQIGNTDYSLHYLLLPK